jgi:hypothetical protein
MSSRSGQAARVSARVARALVCFAAIVAAVTGVPWPAAAAKWVELRVIRDDVRIELLRDGAGRARIEHRVVFLVSGGPLTTLTVRGVDPDAAPEEDGQVLPRASADAGSTEGALPVVVRRVEVEPAAGEGAKRVDLEVLLDGGAGVRRGAYVLLVRYATNLAARGALEGDGPTRTVTWRGPVWDDGLDTTRATFVVPSSPTPPVAVEPGAEGDEEPVFLSTVQRTREQDVLEIVKPYAPKGEAVEWSARIDARAIGLLTAPPVTLPSAKAAAPTGPLGTTLKSLGVDRLAPSPVTLAWMASALLGVVWSLVVVAKMRQAMATHRGAGAHARPLVPLPTLLRAPLSAAAVVAGVWWQVTHPTPTLGALLLAAGGLLVAHRAPSFKPAPRAPGRWLPVSPAEAFAPAEVPRGVWLDASTRTGAIVLFLLLATAVGAGAALATHGMVDRGLLLVLDAAILFPVFLTGRLADLPPDPATAPASLLRAVARRVPQLVGADVVRAVPRIRVPRGGADPDDLRLALAPTRPLAGLRGVAVGVSFGLGAFGWVGLPEILVRVVIGSPADRALGPVARRARAMQGGKPDERVLAFVPRLPTAEITATLAAAVISRLVVRGEVPRSTAAELEVAPPRAA